MPNLSMFIFAFLNRSHYDTPSSFSLAFCFRPMRSPLSPSATLSPVSLLIVQMLILLDLFSLFFCFPPVLHTKFFACSLSCSFARGPFLLCFHQDEVFDGLLACSLLFVQYQSRLLVSVPISVSVYSQHLNHSLNHCLSPRISQQQTTYVLCTVVIS